MKNFDLQTISAPSFRAKYQEANKDAKPPVWKRIKQAGTALNTYKPFIHHWDIQTANGHICEIDTKLEELEIDFEENRFAIDRFYQNEVLAFHNAGYYIHIPDDVQIKDPIYIEYDLDQNNDTLLDLHIIDIGENASATIIIHYKSLDKSKVYKNSLLKVRAGKYANLHLSRIQNLHTCGENYDFSDFHLDDHADISYDTIEFGADINIVSSTTYLDGYMAKMITRPAYLADGERKVDLAYSMIYRGKKSDGQIHGNSAVSDAATKVFRGNIYFEKGSKGAVGKEGSFDILLSEKMTSHAIPTLFCDEDDVVGEHYSSVGKIDESKLLYLMSRGIPRKLAKKLIVESSFRPIIESIPHEPTKEELFATLDLRIE